MVKSRLTTSQLCFTITNLIARLWVLTHQAVGVLAARGALELLQTMAVYDANYGPGLSHF